ncbi:site-2 protease family protein [Ensifer sp. SL37]|uniref:site-2 protease family protein n=1 Tax=Ensifer sp. SL37 TaxID=2995137 RepID=UPI002276EC09|nr:site-2 protease family protein [Ensifer sp. SL37]MCY1746317.1 site-2 protease family protein [Ensifer sp. SL37]
MQWSIKLGTVAGTEVRVHATFALLLIWIWVMHYRIGGPPAAFEGVAFIISVFLCVVLHEFGHIAAARYFGINTPNITLLPIGGLARLERSPDTPLEEFVIAIAGPLVNVAIAGLIVTVVGGALGWEQLLGPQDPRIDFLARLAGVNIFLVVFNMIPAFPMDGGRILRAILAWRLPWARATTLAARIGQSIALAMGIFGVFFNPLLILIAIFVYFAAETEAQGSDVQAISDDTSIFDVMITEFATLGPRARVGEAVELLLATSQSEFPVVDEAGRFEGLMTREGIVRAMKERGAGASVSDVMRRDIPALNEKSPIDFSLKLMREAQTSALPIVDSGERVVGLMNYETIGELMMLHYADEHFKPLGRHHQAPIARQQRPRRRYDHLDKE